MRAAPAVEAALATGQVERMLITLLYGATGAALGLWGAGHAEELGGPAPTRWLIAGAAALAAAVPGAWLARRALPGGPARLGWDGTVWQLRADRVTPLRRLVVALDLGPWMLLRLVPADGQASVWRVAGARSAGADWHALRVALQAHAGTSRPLADDPGAPR
jgi:hypothetical protein